MHLKPIQPPIDTIQTVDLRLKKHLNQAEQHHRRQSICLLPGGEIRPATHRGTKVDILISQSNVPQRFRNPQPFQSGEILYDVSGESTVQCPQLGGVGTDQQQK